MSAIVAGAAAGVFGDGTLSDARTANGGLAVDYPRFGRAQAPLELAVEWSATAPHAVLWIARDYLDRFAIDEVRPPAADVTVGADRVFYTFRTRGAETRVAVRFTLRPKRAGAVRGRLGLGAGPEVETRQWLFP